MCSIAISLKNQWCPVVTVTKPRKIKQLYTNIPLMWNGGSSYSKHH
jgi:hypothetical protein